MMASTRTTALSTPAERRPRRIGDALKATAFDVVLVYAGARGAPESFLLFEQLVKVAHRTAPQASICFNTGPTDSVDALRRWS